MFSLIYTPVEGSELSAFKQQLKGLNHWGLFMCSFHLRCRVKYIPLDYHNFIRLPLNLWHSHWETVYRVQIMFRKVYKEHNLSLLTVGVRFQLSYILFYSIGAHSPHLSFARKQTEQNRLVAENCTKRQTPQRKHSPHLTITYASPLY